MAGIRRQQTYPSLERKVNLEGMLLIWESSVDLNSSIVKTSFSKTTDPSTMADLLHLAKQFFSHEVVRQADVRSEARMTPHTLRQGDGEDEGDGDRHKRDDETTLSLLLLPLMML